MKNGELFFKTKDGTSIYVRIKGKGRPLLLCHGWLYSSRCWQKNEHELAKHFQVITFDFRGHGRSQKTLQGHSISQYAADIHELILELGLQDVILGGWSLSGPVILSYWKQFSKEGRVTALALIDMTTFPYHDGEWNSHGLRQFNADKWNEQVNAMQTDREDFLTTFWHKCFKDGIAPADSAWALTEMHAVPIWLAVAIYSDYVTSDLTDVLPTVTVPTIVMSADGPVFPQGINQGKHIASHLPRSEFIGFPEAGHMLFYENPEKFNKAIIKFGK